MVVSVVSHLQPPEPLLVNVVKREDLVMTQGLSTKRGMVSVVWLILLSTQFVQWVVAVSL